MTDTLSGIIEDAKEGAGVEDLDTYEGLYEHAEDAFTIVEVEEVS